MANFVLSFLPFGNILLTLTHLFAYLIDVDFAIITTNLYEYPEFAVTKPSVIIFGYDELLLASIEFISNQNVNIAAVVFPSNKTDWRAEKIRQTVREKGLETIEQPPRKQIAGFTETLRQIKPDLIYVWSYPMILPAEIINIPKFGSVNVHMGLLPEYRGVNGVRWALLNNENETGMTIHFMDEGIDTGDIIARVNFPITPKDDILSLMKKSRSAGLFLLKNCWQQIANGNAVGKPQDESKANYYSAKMSSLNTINWKKKNFQINNLIRASVIPFPGVSTFWRGHKLVLRKASVINRTENSNDVGIVQKVDSKGVEVSTGTGNLLLTKIEFDEREISPEQLISLGLKVGQRFSDEDIYATKQ